MTCTGGCARVVARKPGGATRRERIGQRVPLVAALGLILSCAHRHDFVWVDDFNPPPGSAKPVVIRPGDVVQVRVFNQDQLSSRTKVRDDGMITLPLLHDVPAAGLAPLALAETVEERLKTLVRNAVVTVSIEERKPPTVLVVGEAVKPGAYAIDFDAGVLQALASAGGLTPDAHDDSIFVVRSSAPMRIRFAYEALLQPTSKARNFKLEDGDVIVVE
jgi:polysaccharide biosynthesis/export protein